MEIDAYDPQTFSRYHCAMGEGSALRTLEYIQSLTRFNEENVTDVVQKLIRAPTSKHTEFMILLHLTQNYTGEVSLIHVLRKAILQQAAE